MGSWAEKDSRQGGGWWTGEVAECGLGVHLSADKLGGATEEQDRPSNPGF